MKKYLNFILPLSIILFLGTSCTNLSIEEISPDAANLSTEQPPIFTDKPVTTTVYKQTTTTASNSGEKRWTSIPKLNKNFEYYRSHGDVTGQVKLTFINKANNKPIVGHSVDCTGCIDTYFQRDTVENNIIYSYPESDINGQMILNITDSQASATHARIDWYNYKTAGPFKPGDEVTIIVTPHIVGKDQKLFFPEAKYEKNPSGQTQLKLTVRDSKGKIITGRNINLTGPIYKDTRTSAFGILDKDGKSNILLPINGAYRFQITTPVQPGTRGKINNVFYQFDAATGYDVSLTVVI